MKYIKWIEVTLKLGICYAAQKLLYSSLTMNNFGSTKSDESKTKKAFWAKRAPLDAQKGTLQMLFGIELTHMSDFEIRAGDITNC